MTRKRRAAAVVVRAVPWFILMEALRIAGLMTWQAFVFLLVWAALLGFAHNFAADIEDGGWQEIRPGMRIRSTDPDIINRARRELGDDK